MWGDGFNGARTRVQPLLEGGWCVSTSIVFNALQRGRWNTPSRTIQMPAQAQRVVQLYTASHDPPEAHLDVAAVSLGFRFHFSSV